MRKFNAHPKKVLIIPSKWRRAASRARMRDGLPRLVM